MRFFFSFSFFPEQQTCQIWVGHSFEIRNLILDEQDTRQNTELKKYVVQSVSLCLSYVFLYILTSKFIKKKKLGKKLSKQKKFKKKKKNSNLEFCWNKRAPKNKCARQLWDIGFIFLALVKFQIEIRFFIELHGNPNCWWRHVRHHLPQTYCRVIAPWIILTWWCLMLCIELLIIKQTN